MPSSLLAMRAPGSSSSEKLCGQAQHRRRVDVDGFRCPGRDRGRQVEEGVRSCAIATTGAAINKIVIEYVA
jgi:hypothetical protein